MLRNTNSNGEGVEGGAPNTNTNEASTNVAKKSNQVSGGILGGMKERIIQDMIQAVQGNYKILICDKVGAEIISSCFRIHELMALGVTLVEDLYMLRQPVTNSPGLYLIQPDKESVDRVMQDWRRLPCYESCHLFFTTTAPDSIINQIASEQSFVEQVKTCKDLLIDFAAPERLCFHFGMIGDLNKLFPVEIALSGGRENILGQVGRRLVSVVNALNQGRPTVRYQGSSRLALAVARNLCEELANNARTFPGSRVNQDRPDGPIFIIVDRSYDAVDPLLHQRYYQCLVQDLVPLKEGLYYEQTVTTASGLKDTVIQPIDEQDPYWCAYRHAYLMKCLSDFPAQLKKLIEDNPALANGMDKGEMSLKAVGSAVRALPEFQEKKAKLSMHVDICSAIMENYSRMKLSTICEIEQDMAVPRKSFKDLFETVKRTVSDTSFPPNVRLRLLMLFVASNESRELTEAKKLSLLQESGFAAEISRINAIALLNNRSGRIKQDYNTSKDGTPASSTSDPPKRTLRSKLLRGDAGASSSATSGPAASKTGSDAPAPTEDPFKNQCQLIAEAVVQNQLSNSDFPTVNAAVSQAAAPGGNSRASLRAGLLGRRAASEANHTTPTYDSRRGGRGGATLDLGHEGTVELNSTQKIVLFVLGGITYGETRAVYEVSKRMGREVILGGTSILLPEKYISQLASLQ